MLKYELLVSFLTVYYAYIRYLAHIIDLMLLIYPISRLLVYPRRMKTVVDLQKSVRLIFIIDRNTVFGYMFISFIIVPILLVRAFCVFSRKSAKEGFSTGFVLLRYPL